MLDRSALKKTLFVTRILRSAQRKENGISPGHELRPSMLRS